LLLSAKPGQASAQPPGRRKEVSHVAEPLLCLRDAEQAAAGALPHDVRDFIAGGSEAEVTLAANRAALDAVFLTPRVLTGIATSDPSTMLVGCRSVLPVAIAPMSYQRLVHPEGEIGLARAAREAGIPLVLSMMSSCLIEEVAAVGGTVWFQLYLLRDRGQVSDLIQRAEEAGCRALVLTVDVPRIGRRLRDMRNGFAVPPQITAANLRDDAAELVRQPSAGASGVAMHTNQVFDPALSWADVAWLRERTRLPLVLKGILHPEDARLAVEHGASAVVVSNHGGRQLDGAVASITALPGVCAAVDGRCEVLLDSGIRSGTDVLRALALGASGVLLGRPALWGLASGGARGAAQVLSLLADELTEAMLLAGCPDVGSARQLRATV
jgi:4-hydroxymandelate oxidase